MPNRIEKLFHPEEYGAYIEAKNTLDRKIWNKRGVSRS